MHCMKKIGMISIIILCFPVLSLSGLNSSAQIAIDMDISTTDYDASISAIENKASVNTEQTISVAIVAQNVNNLDTYQMDVVYDPDILELVNTVEDDPVVAGLTNILKKNKGFTLGFTATKTQAGMVNIANTLVGNNPDQAPEGSGIMAILTFRKLQPKETVLSVANVHFIDSFRKQDTIVKRSIGYFSE